MTIFGIKQNSSGYTVIEMAIVIVLIGLIASMVAVLYPQYIQRTRDTARKSDLTQIAAALNAYAIKENSFVEAGSGCGLQGDGNGWFNASSGQYPKSIYTCLKEAGLLPQTLIDPTGCISDTGGKCGAYLSNVPAYMKATCTKNGNKITYVFAFLETQPQNKAAVDAACDPGTVAGFNTNTQKWGTSYGMNYYLATK